MKGDSSGFQWTTMETREHNVTHTFPYTQAFASFKTCFLFSVTNVGPGPIPVSNGDGLEFVIAPDDHTMGSP